MSNFTTVVDKVVGDTFTQPMWATYIEQNLNKGVNRPLADVILGASAASFDFTSIDQNFAQLMLVVIGRGDTAAANAPVLLRLNNDSGGNYSHQFAIGNTTSMTVGEAFAQTSGTLGAVPAATAGANHPGVCEVLIPHYTGTTFFKQWSALSGRAEGVTTGKLFADDRSGVWVSTAAINRITIFPSAGNFVAGSRATLYGLAF